MNAIPDALLPHLPEVFFRQRPDFSFDHLGANVGPLTGAAAEEWKRAPGLFWQSVHELDAEPLRKHVAECVRQPDGLATTFRLRHRKTGRVVWISEFRRALFDAGGHLVRYQLTYECTRPATESRALTRS